MLELAATCSTHQADGNARLGLCGLLLNYDFFHVAATVDPTNCTRRCAATWISSSGFCYLPQESIRVFHATTLRCAQRPGVTRFGKACQTELNRRRYTRDSGCGDRPTGKTVQGEHTTVPLVLHLTHLESAGGVRPFLGCGVANATSRTVLNLCHGSTVKGFLI